MTTFWLIVFVLTPKGLMPQMHEALSERHCIGMQAQAVEFYAEERDLPVWTQCVIRRES